MEIDFADLEFHERLGSGSAGTVYSGCWKSKKKIVAIKKLLTIEKEVWRDGEHQLEATRNIFFFGLFRRPKYSVLLATEISCSSWGLSPYNQTTALLLV